MKVFVGSLPFSISESKVRADFAECGEVERFDMPLNDQGKPSGNAYIYFKSEAGVLAALEYHGTEYEGRTIKVMRAVRQRDPNSKGKGKHAKGKADAPRESRARNDQTTVFVGGLESDMKKETLQKDFGECGEIDAIRMVMTPEGAFKGIAFIVFKDESGVKEALKYNGDQYGNRTIKVSRAGEKSKSKDKGDAGKGKGKGKGKGLKYIDAYDN